jgi:hypothetical protein
MPPVSVRIPSWADPQNASVLDDWWTRTARTLGGMLGAADPASQAMAIGAPLELPEGGPLTTLKAYHGSGADFDRFDPTKIGTGEGSQAFSYGHYAAQQEGVAQTYKNAARRRMLAEIEQEPAKVGEALFDVQSAKGDTVNGKVPFGPMRTLHTREQLAEKFGNGTYDTSHMSAPLQKQVLDHLTPPTTGKMYELNLHVSPDELLDWDKPLSQQSQKVQQALKKIQLADPEKHATLTGQNIYDRAAASTGMIGTDAHMAASDLLNEAGIKGVQFLDRASRATSGGELIDVSKTADGWRAKIKVTNRGGLGFTSPTDAFTTSRPYATEAEARGWAQDKIGGGSRNFSIFPGNEHLMEIARKYGVSLPVAASLYKYQQAQQK